MVFKIMKKILVILISIAYFSLISCVQIINMQPFVPHSYTSLDTDHRRFLSEVYYQECTNVYLQDKAIEWISLEYQYNNLLLRGFIIQPKQLVPGKQYSVILYARGGYEEVFKITAAEYYFFKKLVADDYIIIAPQHRGCDGGEGEDAFGGDDVYDFIACKEIAEQLPYINTSNLFLLGWSRGAITIFRSLSLGLKPKAVAIGAGVSDLLSSIKENEAFEHVFNRLIFRNNLFTQNTRDEEYKKRSALYWPEKITCPVLLLHGDQDKSVAISQSYCLAEQLALHNKLCKFILYSGVGHEIFKETDAAEQAVMWFEQYK